MAALPGMLEHDCTRAGWSFEQAAGRLGVSVRDYRELEAGARSPSFETWDRICKVFGWAADVCGTWLTRTTKMPPSAPTSRRSALPRSRSFAASLRLPVPTEPAVLRALTARPASADLATLIVMAGTDEVVRLRLLHAIRDLGV